MNSLISIVIPTFNRAHLILDALDTCVQQTYRPLEIVVVDDGSTDSTLSVLQKWSKDQLENISIKIIEQNKRGANAARNNGIKNSDGNFIAFLDSDDLWERTKLSKQIELIQNDDSVGAVYCGYREVDLASGNVLMDIDRTWIEGNILQDLLIKDATAPTSTYLVRKKVFTHVGRFDENLMARQDWDMWIRISEKFQIKVVKENLMDLRQHNGIRTASNPQNEINAYKCIRQKYKDLLSQQPNNVQREALANYYKRLGRVHFHYKKSKVVALKYYVKSIIIFPRDFDNWAALSGFFLPKLLKYPLKMFWNRTIRANHFKIRSH